MKCNSHSKTTSSTSHSLWEVLTAPTVSSHLKTPTSLSLASEAPSSNSPVTYKSTSLSPAPKDRLTSTPPKPFLKTFSSTSPSSKPKPNSTSSAKTASKASTDFKHFASLPVPEVMSMSTMAPIPLADTAISLSSSSPTKISPNVFVPISTFLATAQNNVSLAITPVFPVKALLPVISVIRTI
jgi:hypothetical protein